MKKNWLVPIVAVTKCETEDIICISVGETENLNVFDGKTVDWDYLR